MRPGLVLPNIFFTSLVSTIFGYYTSCHWPEKDSRGIRRHTNRKVPPLISGLRRFSVVCRKSFWLVNFVCLFRVISGFRVPISVPKKFWIGQFCLLVSCNLRESPKISSIHWLGEDLFGDFIELRSTETEKETTKTTQSSQWGSAALAANLSNRRLLRRIQFWFLVPICLFLSHTIQKGALISGTSLLIFEPH